MTQEIESFFRRGMAAGMLVSNRIFLRREGKILAVKPIYCIKGKDILEPAFM